VTIDKYQNTRQALRRTDAEQSTGTAPTQTKAQTPQKRNTKLGENHEHQ